MERIDRYRKWAVCLVFLALLGAGCGPKEPLQYYVHFTGESQMERHLDAARDELDDLEIELAEDSLDRARNRLEYLRMATYGQRVGALTEEIEKTRTGHIPARVEFAVGYDPELMEPLRDVMKLGDLRKRLSRAPYPRRVEVNHIILYYTRGPGRKQYNIYLKRLARYRQHIQRILRTHGLPDELICVAMIESAGDPTRISHAGAAGLWQFMPETARKYDLVVREGVDQRFDPVLETYAAARYLKFLLKMFNKDIEAALAGYNCGEGLIEQVLAHPRIRSVWQVPYHGKVGAEELPSIPRETYDYIARWYAVAIVHQNLKHYDFAWPATPEDPFMLVHVSGAVDCAQLATDLQVQPDVLFALNPSLKVGRTPSEGATAVRLPPESKDVYAGRLRQSRHYRISYVYRHKVTAYQTLRAVAQAYGVSAVRIADVNDLGEENRLEPGTVIKIPTTAGNERARIAARENVRSWRAFKGTLWDTP